MRYLVFSTLAALAALAALALLPAGEAESAWLQQSKNDLYSEEYRAEKQRWRTLRIELRRLGARHIRWGKEKRAHRSNMVALEPGFATSSPGKIEVEWFFTYLGESAQMETLLVEWTESLRQGTGNRVSVKWSPVSSMRGRSLQFNDYHAVHQLMAFTAAAIGKRATIHREMRKILSGDVGSPAKPLRSEHEVERLLKRIGISVEEFRAAADSERVQRRARETTEKLKTISIRAEDTHEDANREPRDPILLINGKFLVQGSLAGSVKNSFRIANWLIRRELEGRRR